MPAEEQTVDDESATVVLWEAAGPTRPRNDPRADFRQALAGPASSVLGVRDGGAKGGTAVVGEYGHRGGLSYVGVEPGRQGRGVGRRLVDAVEEWLRARGVQRALLVVRREHVAARGLYPSMGVTDEDVVVLGRRRDAR